MAVSDDDAVAPLDHCSLLTGVIVVDPAAGEPTQDAAARACGEAAVADNLAKVGGVGWLNADEQRACETAVLNELR